MDWREWFILGALLVCLGVIAWAVWPSAWRRTARIRPVWVCEDVTGSTLAIGDEPLATRVWMVKGVESCAAAEASAGIPEVGEEHPYLTLYASRPVAMKIKRRLYRVVVNYRAAEVGADWPRLSGN